MIFKYLGFKVLVNGSTIKGRTQILNWYLVVSKYFIWPPVLYIDMLKTVKVLAIIKEENYCDISQNIFDGLIIEFDHTKSLYKISQL